MDDCFYDFYERLDALTLPQEPEEELEEEEVAAPAIEEITTDLSFGITEEYFDKVDHASGILRSFFDRYIADSRMHQALHEDVNTHRRKNYDDLKLMVLVDVVRAYESLNHSTRLNCPEGIALLLLLVKFFKPDEFISFQGLKEIPVDIINLDGIVPYIAACSDEIEFVGDDESIISSLLRKVHPKADNTYRMCMYHLFEAVAQVDGVITQSEQEYLMTLLHLDDDDLSNDIKID